MTSGPGLTCPSCTTTLVPVDRSGVLIDACPSCRGIWLDRGELDKLIALEQSSEDFYAEISGRSPENRDDERESSGHASGKKRRGSFLGDFLDFG